VEFLSLIVLLLVFPLHVCYTLCSCPKVLRHYVLIFASQSFFSVSVSALGGFYWNILKFRDSFLGCVQSTKKSIKGIFYFCYSGFHLYISLFFLTGGWIRITYDLSSETMQARRECSKIFKMFKGKKIPA
jgi:hypothetical protein